MNNTRIYRLNFDWLKSSKKFNFIFIYNLTDIVDNGSGQRWKVSSRETNALQKGYS